MKRIFYGACMVLALCTMMAITSSAQTFKTLATLDGVNNGTSPCPPNYIGCPEGGLVQGTDGNLYGTTYAGGANGYGTVYRLILSGQKGVVTTLHSFGGADGANPAAGLVLGTEGDFYGTTYAGGANGYGTVFKITRRGAVTTLYSFCSLSNCADGEFPNAGLVQATNGKFYGVAEAGGGGGGNGVCNFVNMVGCGTVFEITPRGKLTTLYSFCSLSNCADGVFPTGTLIQGSDGELYGTTAGGAPGITSPGSIFKVTPSGKLTPLYAFVCTGDRSSSNRNCPNGQVVPAGLVQATDGYLYGTTTAGGANDSCVIGVGSIFGCGTVFNLTTNGVLTTLYSFCSSSNCADGEAPWAGLVQGTDGNFYGTTFSGFPGVPSYGTVFSITPDGALTTLHTFCTQSGCLDGSNPLAGLVQATNGSFYGTTSSVCGPVQTTPACGVVATTGTVFSLSMGLPAFVKTMPAAGEVGSTVTILGNGLTDATSVTFNGTPDAAFTVVSSTEIGSTVPTGATTGAVQVETSGGTLSSNVPFRVP